MKSVEFPERRDEVISAVRALSDPEYQRRVWVERAYPQSGFFDDFTLNVNILGDAGVWDYPRETIGCTLASVAEAEAMESLVARLEETLEGVGRESPDSDFLASCLWPGVVEAARSALALLTR
ncbi:SCO4402 family protein [Streptomyces chrestomyceticus]|uniref:SCO4402 family protein n=1 Tax=Streptomyces chrestomyceticus TaxID=68185 RepID=UPI0037A87701